MTSLPPVCCGDARTWRHKGQKIDLPRLLQLIDENGGPDALDLHGADLSGLDADPETLRPLAAAYAQSRGAQAGSAPMWHELGGRICIALGRAHLEKANLMAAHLGTANLMAARLEGANLWDVDLQSANLIEAHLEGANLNAAHAENANLREAHLEYARLAGAHLENAYLFGACLENAKLVEAHLDDADLRCARAAGADLRGAYLQNASFRDAHLEGCDLRHSHLDHADLGGASLDGAFWYGCHFDRTRVRRDSLGQAVGDELLAHKEKTPVRYREASEAYLLLKNHFNSTGRYEDASWAYIKEQQMEKMAYHWEWRSCGWQVWHRRGSLWRWLRNWLYELTTGYGERPWNPVIIAVFSMLAFAVGYSVSGAVDGVADALIYSLATFATFNLARPEVQPQGTGIETASSLEALLGIGMLALLVFTLGNRMSRS